MTYIHYENYKGGINNLCVATDSDTGLTATSTKSKERAIVLLDSKITKAGGFWATRKAQTNERPVLI